ncbi:hypothetical protein [Haloarcula saliterrae]|nr:hypothetical protein [Haloarcula sp. S1CR25-12]
MYAAVFDVDETAIEEALTDQSAADESLEEMDETDAAADSR